MKELKLILASRSPRRRELMTGAGLLFTVADGYEVEEVWPEGTPPEEVPEYLARLKSDAYPHPLADGEILITADTVVILDGSILGKPKGRAEAIGMIEGLSGREHTVATGVCIRGAHRAKSFTAISRVAFRELERAEIEYYVDTFKPFDKAGAYAIQEWIGLVGVKSVEGSFYNVMGLPIQRLYVELKEF